MSEFYNFRPRPISFGRTRFPYTRRVIKLYIIFTISLFFTKYDGGLHPMLSFRIDLRRVLFSPRGTLTMGIKRVSPWRILTGDRFDFSRCFETERGERYSAADAEALYN